MAEDCCYTDPEDLEEEAKPTLTTADHHCGGAKELSEDAALDWHYACLTPLDLTVDGSFGERRNIAIKSDRNGECKRACTVKALCGIDLPEGIIVPELRDLTLNTEEAIRSVLRQTRTVDVIVSPPFNKCLVWPSQSWLPSLYVEYFDPYAVCELLGLMPYMEPCLPEPYRRKMTHNATLPSELGLTTSSGKSHAKSMLSSVIAMAEDALIKFLTDMEPAVWRSLSKNVGLVASAEAKATAAAVLSVVSPINAVPQYFLMDKEAASLYNLVLGNYLGAVSQFILHPDVLPRPLVTLDKVLKKLQSSARNSFFVKLNRAAVCVLPSEALAAVMGLLNQCRGPAEVDQVISFQTFGTLSRQHLLTIQLLEQPVINDSAYHKVKWAEYSMRVDGRHANIGEAIREWAKRSPLTELSLIQEDGVTVLAKLPPAKIFEELELFSSSMDLTPSYGTAVYAILDSTPTSAAAPDRFAALGSDDDHNNYTADLLPEVHKSSPVCTAGVKRHSSDNSTAASKRSSSVMDAVGCSDPFVGTDNDSTDRAMPSRLNRLAQIADSLLSLKTLAKSDYSAAKGESPGQDREAASRSSAMPPLSMERLYAELDALEDIRDNTAIEEYLQRNANDDDNDTDAPSYQSAQSTLTTSSSVQSANITFWRTYVISRQAPLDSSLKKSLRALIPRFIGQCVQKVELDYKNFTGACTVLTWPTGRIFMNACMTIPEVKQHLSPALMRCARGWPAPDDYKTLGNKAVTVGGEALTDHVTNELVESLIKLLYEGNSTHVTLSVRCTECTVTDFLDSYRKCLEDDYMAHKEAVRRLKTRLETCCDSHTWQVYFSHFFITRSVTAARFAATVLSIRGDGH